MNIITADFNWISFLIIIVATVIGMLKSNSKKQVRKPIFQEPDFQLEEEDDENESEERYTNAEYTPLLQDIADMELPGDHYGIQQKEKLQEESPISNETEEDNEEYTRFDIRQAIISSEILKRPQF